MPKVDNKKFYKSAIKVHGESARGVHWNSRYHQEIRFDILLSLLGKPLSSYTLVDAGCGFGDFFNYLKEKNMSPKKYTGLDILQEMQNIAVKKTSQEILITDICRDNLPQADYYVCSGALNTLTKFETHLFIQNCYTSSKIALVFNMLHGDKQSDTYNYITTQQVQAIAKDLEVKKIVFKDNYLENDLTVGFFK